MRKVVKLSLFILISFFMFSGVVSAANNTSTIAKSSLTIKNSSGSVWKTIETKSSTNFKSEISSVSLNGTVITVSDGYAYDRAHCNSSHSCKKSKNYYRLLVSNSSSLSSGSKIYTSSRVEGTGGDGSSYLKGMYCNGVSGDVKIQSVTWDQLLSAHTQTCSKNSKAYNKKSNELNQGVENVIFQNLTIDLKNSGLTDTSATIYLFILAYIDGNYYVQRLYVPSNNITISGSNFTKVVTPIKNVSFTTNYDTIRTSSYYFYYGAGINFVKNRNYTSDGTIQTRYHPYLLEVNDIGQYSKGGSSPTSDKSHIGNKVYTYLAYASHDGSTAFKYIANPAKITINKIDENEEPLSGANFQISKYNTNTNSYNSGCSGCSKNNKGSILEISNLSSGTYMIREATPPPSYEGSTSKIVFKVSSSGEISIIEIKSDDGKASYKKESSVHYIFTYKNSLKDDDSCDFVPCIGSECNYTREGNKCYVSDKTSKTPTNSSTNLDKICPSTELKLTDTLLKYLSTTYYYKIESGQIENSFNEDTVTSEICGTSGGAVFYDESYYIPIEFYSLASINQEITYGVSAKYKDNQLLGTNNTISAGKAFNFEFYFKNLYSLSYDDEYYHQYDIELNIKIGNNGCSDGTNVAIRLSKDDILNNLFTKDNNGGFEKFTTYDNINDFYKSIVNDSNLEKVDKDSYANALGSVLFQDSNLEDSEINIDVGEFECDDTKEESKVGYICKYGLKTAYVSLTDGKNGTVDYSNDSLDSSKYKKYESENSYFVPFISSKSKEFKFSIFEKTYDNIGIIDGSTIKASPVECDISLDNKLNVDYRIIDVDDPFPKADKIYDNWSSYGTIDSKYDRITNTYKASNGISYFSQSFADSITGYDTNYTSFDEMDSGGYINSEKFKNLNLNRNLKIGKHICALGEWNNNCDLPIWSK